MDTRRHNKRGEGKRRNQYKDRDRALYMRQNHERGPRRESFDCPPSGSLAASPDWRRPRDVGRSGGTKRISVALSQGGLAKPLARSLQAIVPLFLRTPSLWFLCAVCPVGSANARARLVSISLMIAFATLPRKRWLPVGYFEHFHGLASPAPRPGGWPEIAKTGQHTNNTNNTYVFLNVFRSFFEYRYIGMCEEYSCLTTTEAPGEGVRRRSHKEED